MSVNQKPVMDVITIKDERYMIHLTDKTKRDILRWMHVAVIVLSLMLIAYISYDTFAGIPFLENSRYMTFQLWVCVVFIADFAVGLAFAADKWRYVRHNWFFLFVSIPYLNIIRAGGMSFTPQELYFIRFIPLLRGALALAIVVGYISSNKVTGLFVSYMVVMVSVIYFSSLILYYREHDINPLVPDFWAALWWACMDATTSGSNINPVTAIGKILGGLLSVMGMIMFPLFTVYITNIVQRYNSRRPLIPRAKAGSATA